MAVIYHTTPLTDEVTDGAEPDHYHVRFESADGAIQVHDPETLPAGKVGTWSIELSPTSDINAGGGYLLERWGFLFGHLTQDQNPAGRDFVTLEADTDARLELIVNTDNPSHRPPVARVLVAEGSLRTGDRVSILIGDRRQGGPGSEIYDATTDARLVVGVDREGTGTFKALSDSPRRIRIVSEPVADLLRILAPSIVTPDEPFDLHVQIFDPHRNVCEQFVGTVSFEPSSDIVGLPDTLTFTSDDAGIRILQDVSITTPGIHRIEARIDGSALTATSNPIEVATEPSQRLLWGEFHCHSWGDTTLGLMDEPSFKVHPMARHEQARKVGRYDFCAPGPMSPPLYADAPEQWAAFRDAFRTFDEPGRYVPFLASEVHARPGGDRNVVYLDDEPEPHPQRATLTELLAAYGNRDDVILESHVGGGPPSWTRDPTPRERLVEIASGHGAFEWILQDALDHDYRPAIIGSTDAHLPAVGAPMAAHTFRGRFQKVLNIRDTGPGSGAVAAVWSSECTRQSIWNAIDKRATYATTGARILLRVAIGKARAGEEITVDNPPAIRIDANGCAPIERVDLIRNDRCLASWHPNECDIQLTHRDETPLRQGAYYVRLRQTDGEYAWSTPIWVDCDGGRDSDDSSLPKWNAHEPIDLSSIRPNGAEQYEEALRAYLETEEDPSRFKEITPVRLLDEITGRSALFLAWLTPENIPVSIRWYYEFEMPRLHLDWGWRDYGMSRGI